LADHPRSRRQSEGVTFRMPPVPAPAWSTIRPNDFDADSDPRTDAGWNARSAAHTPRHVIAGARPGGSPSLAWQRVSPII
jgi:hypothetical protein